MHRSLEQTTSSPHCATATMKSFVAFCVNDYSWIPLFSPRFPLFLRFIVRSYRLSLASAPDLLIFLIRSSIHFSIQPSPTIDSLELIPDPSRPAYYFILYCVLCWTDTTSLLQSERSQPRFTKDSFLHLWHPQCFESRHVLLQTLTGRSGLHNSQYNPCHEHHRSPCRHRRKFCHAGQDIHRLQILFLRRRQPCHHSWYEL